MRGTLPTALVVQVGGPAGQAGGRRWKHGRSGNKESAARARSQEADRAVLTAVVQLLAERGSPPCRSRRWPRAGVGKTTIYRRWPSKGLLALDAFVTSFREQQPLPDTGTLRGDLPAALSAWVRAVTETPMGPMLTGLIAEAQHDPELDAAWRDRVTEPLRSQRRIILDRAIARGEIPASVDQEVALDLLFGSPQHRLLLGHLPMTEDFIHKVVDVILGGIQPLRSRPQRVFDKSGRAWRVCASRSSGDVRRSSPVP